MRGRMAPPWHVTGDCGLRDIDSEFRQLAMDPQRRELMAQDNKFQQEVKALAEPRPHCRKPSKDPSRHEL